MFITITQNAEPTECLGAWSAIIDMKITVYLDIY